MAAKDDSIPSEKPGVVNLPQWEQGWQKATDAGKDPQFHVKNVHPILSKHLEQLTGGRSGLKFLFPLCGKAMDMKWLADQGHTIVGVDGVEDAARQFFQENAIQPTVTEVPALNGKLYQGMEGRISIYICDYFNFSSEVKGQFDAIWDRGAFVAINEVDREKYIRLMKALLKPDGRCLMEVMQYEPSLFPGPPHNVPTDELKQLLGDYNMALLDTVDHTERLGKLFNLPWINTAYFLIKASN
ncbi:probable thiopurine S-methyltransferase [Branchiostoma floridae]|uniref:thiopurine S-methyltransferase n=1 Tax=Branchiostoma floridae TaxID=7739 RepID=A0A9J7MHC5_BRAFL|nr:probable thiopurine S-methyltransferase [Branchiostoma floridae]XP_035667665.1 probable thiopurine S-methyltransferase [Branchiostoma floridae]XP_035667666.1 probable thiopurine S-methyltransferase [Branchiostoma floridae]XP_035667667.1 probable thiopurine S-methyltransferase [Branchiostoma floridae]